MNIWISLFALAATHKIALALTDKIICYHGSWSAYRGGNGNFGVSDIDPTLCTHLIYSFIGADSTTGSVKILDTNLEVNKRNLASFVALKEKNPNLKVLVAIGGWSEGSLKYSIIAANANLRSTLVQSALTFLRTYGFDGLDVDWEYPALRGGASVDKTNFITLLKELRASFEPYGLLLTAAVAANPGQLDQSYDVPSMNKYLDFINVMAYDFHGSWDGVTGQNAPLYASSIDSTVSARQLNVNASIHGWIKRGASPSKLALGLGFYGRTYTLSSTSSTGLGAAVSGAGNPGIYAPEPGMLGYNEICEKQTTGGWTTVWDDVQKNPYTYKGNQWVGYDNEKSISTKVEYAKSLNLGAVMIWSIETDDFRGICGNKYPLLNTINKAIGSGSTNTETENDTEQSTQGSNIEESPEEDTSDTQGKSSEDGSSVVCSRAGYVRDKTNGEIFYYCLPVDSSYIPLQQSCASGLEFDECTQVCNWPDLVSC